MKHGNVHQGAYIFNEILTVGKGMQDGLDQFLGKFLNKKFLLANLI